MIVTKIAGSAGSTNAALNVSSGTLANPQVSAFALNNGVFNLSVSVSSSQNYTVQASTNLTDWTNLFTTNPVSLSFTWSDPVASNFNQRFYRVEVGP